MKPVRTANLLEEEKEDEEGDEEEDEEEGDEKEGDVQKGDGDEVEKGKDGPGPVMVSDTLCPAVHILGT